MERNVSGKFYAVNGERCKIFDLEARCISSGRWSLGSPNGSVVIDYFYDHNMTYKPIEQDAAPVSNEIIQLVHRTVQAGQASRIAAVLVSNRVAARLFLEGVIDMIHFGIAREMRVQEKLRMVGSAVPVRVFCAGQLVSMTPADEMVVSSAHIDEDWEAEFTVPVVSNGEVGRGIPVKDDATADARAIMSIVLPGVCFDSVNLPLIVYPERVVGAEFTALIDVNGIAL